MGGTNKSMTTNTKQCMLILLIVAHTWSEGGIKIARLLGATQTKQRRKNKHGPINGPKAVDLNFKKNWSIIGCNSKPDGTMDVYDCMEISVFSLLVKVIRGQQNKYV